jgi:F-type H+-transporting ATPase subunit delta
VSQDTVAHRYAQAIFDLGVETSSLRLLTDDMRTLATAFSSSSDLQQIMGNPLVPEQARLAAVHEIAERLGLSRLAANAAGLLTRRKRMACLPAIALELERLTDEQSGTQRVTVISAEPLSEPYAERLTRELGHMTGKTVVLERRLDPELLAGVVIKLGDQIIDGSARARLADLRSQLLSA